MAGFQDAKLEIQRVFARLAFLFFFENFISLTIASFGISDPETVFHLISKIPWHP